jgi:dipeptidyl aminopeptidase/acylaminoacyl peptidase
MRCLFPSLILLISCLAARGDVPRPVVAAATPWTLDDVLFTEVATDFQVSPDGRHAVWVKAVMDRDKGEQVSHLVRTDLDTHREVALTRGPDSCDHPCWSPDGRRIAFLSSRAGKAQVWLLDHTGGEPWPLTETARGVQRFGWAGADAVVFVAQEEPSLRESTLESEKDDSIVVEDDAHEPPARLFQIKVASKKVTRLSTNTDRIELLAVSPDGRRAVAVHNRSLRYAFDNKVKPAVLLHDLTGGKPTPIFTDTKLNISHVRWAPDGKGFYAINDLNSQPQFSQAGVPELHYFDLSQGKAVRVDLGWDKSLATQDANDDAPGYALTPDGFVALLADGVHNRPARFRRSGASWQREWLTGTDVAHVFGIQTSPDGKTLLYATSTASDPPQWHAARLDGARIEQSQPIAPLNTTLRSRPRARSEVLRWKGAHDDEVEGILLHPHGAAPAGPRPLVVMIHGGPALADQDAWDDTWMHPVNLLCARGAYVLRPNYHGSSNYGLQWLESITHGNYGDPELIDIEKGVDTLIERGLVNPQRLAVTGWSNGGVLANLLTARTTRYRAAAAGAGSIEYVSDWASCEFGDAFDRYYFGAPPLDDPGWYQRRSPFWRLDRVRTPTLIFFGTEDRTVATQQGWLHYRALQQLGKAPVRFVQFPGEKHLLRKLAHQRRKVTEELAWLYKYLFNSEKEVNRSLKPDSPLAWSLGRAKALREGNRYGVAVKGVLTPEVVPFGSLRVGRFEVTRAQLAAFDKTLRVEPGRDNYPASGVGYEQARDYCAWLSKHTGRTYRLPTEEEAAELYDRTEAGENTLDWWAGYAPNPEDAARLREHLHAVPGVAPLLREVGSFRGAGKEEMVFDLGGNVAEWATDKDGKGVLRGGSADMPADSRSPKNKVALDYRGFRVVLEQKGKRD